MIDWKIGKPYSFRFYNCWDYVVDIRNQAGIDTPLFSVRKMSDAAKKIESEMHNVDHGLKKVESPKNFDVVIGFRMFKGKRLFHCGIWYNGLINHCCLGAKQVVSQEQREFIRDYEAITLWR